MDHTEAIALANTVAQNGATSEHSRLKKCDDSIFHVCEPLLIQNKNGNASLEVPILQDPSEEMEEKDPRGGVVQRQQSLAGSGWRRYIGIFMAMLASMCFSMAILIVKSLPSVHAFSFGVWRFLGILVPSVPMLFLEKQKSNNAKVFDTLWPLTESAKRKTFGHLIIRCVFGCCAIILQFYSLNYLNIADSALIVFSTPCFVTLFAWAFLGESCGITPIFAALCSLLGVAIVCKPPILQGESFDQELLIGIALSFTSMICASMVFISLRCLRNTNVGVITCSFGVLGFIQCAFLCLAIQRFDIPQNGWEWFLVFGVASLSFVGQTLMTCSFRFEQASAISLVRSCDVIFAFIWQYIFLNVKPDIYSLLGSVLVVFSVFVIGLRKWVATLNEDDVHRKRLWFLLR